MTAYSSADKSALVRLVHRLGTLPSVYSALRSTMGGDRYWRHLLNDVAGVEPWMRVLDIGCGPARVLDHMPKGTAYVGVDHNARCIDQATRRFSPPARFIQAEAAAIAEIGGEFDLILAMGLLHHLSDADARLMLDGTAHLLAPGGRLITADVVDLPQAAPSAAWLLARDRGDYVRQELGYLRLLEGAFERVDSTLNNGLLRVPLSGAAYPLLIATMAQPVRPGAFSSVPSAIDESPRVPAVA